MKKKNLIIYFLFILGSINLIAQINTDEAPVGFNLNEEEFKTDSIKILPSPDMQKMYQEDDKNGLLSRFGNTQNVASQDSISGCPTFNNLTGIISTQTIWGQGAIQNATIPGGNKLTIQSCGEIIFNPTFEVQQGGELEINL